MSAEKVREATITPAPSPGRLSPEHKRMLCKDSAISSEIIAERGYYTATIPSEVPKKFSAKQRRRVGLVIPQYSPDGETVSYQLKPNYPLSASRKYENPYSEKIIADVHPTMRDKIKDVREPVFFTEGARTADALTSQGMCTVMLAGVWNFAKPGTRGKELLPCLEHVPLKGRVTFVGYDADSRTNPDVQEALRRCVALLEERGARVLVIYPPVVDDDPRTGIDDYLAHGGDFDELIRSAKPFKPVDIRKERLSKDEALRGEIAALWATWEAMPTTKRSDCTDRSTLGELIKTLELRGENLTVRVSTRTLAQTVRVSDKAVRNSLERLEKKRYLRKAPGPRKKKEAQAYVLLPGGGALGSHNERERRLRKESQAQQERKDALSYAESSPSANLARGGEESVPELRASKVVHSWERIESPNGAGGRWRVVDSYAVSRLGKKRGEILRFLVRAGGSATLSELVAQFGTDAQKQRPRDFRRRQLAPLEGFRLKKTDRVDPGPPIHVRDFEKRRAGTLEGFGIQVQESDRADLGPPILEIDGDLVRLLPEWREHLEEVRTATQEQEDTRLQAEKIARQRERFHNPEKAGPNAEPTPDIPKPQLVREILGNAGERDELSRIREQREKVGVTVETFVRDRLAAHGGCIRLELLKEVWRESGGNEKHVYPALKTGGFEMLSLSEYSNAIFVYPPPLLPSSPPKGRDEEQHPHVAEVVELHPYEPTPAATEPEPEKRPKNKDGVFVHGPACDCDLCEYEVLPRYARPYAGVSG